MNLDDIKFPGATPLHGFTIDKALQKGAVTGIVRDFGVYDTPDAFYAAQGSNLCGLKRWLFENIIRRGMNRNVERIRDGAV